MRSNDIAALSFAEALLAEAAIPVVCLDLHASVMEGSLGILPRRLMVDDADVERARAILAEAGLDLGN